MHTCMYVQCTYVPSAVKGLSRTHVRKQKPCSRSLVNGSNRWETIACDKVFNHPPEVINNPHREFLVALEAMETGHSNPHTSSSSTGKETDILLPDHHQKARGLASRLKFSMFDGLGDAS